MVADAEPSRVHVPPIGRRRHASDVLVDQLRAIDNRRLVEGPLARLAETSMHRVGTALRDLLDVDDL